MCLWPPSLSVSLEGKIYDSFLRSVPHRPVAGPVTVVDLDEASLESLGQWPWPRYRVARLLEKIREGGAAAVGLDMVFAEPDRTSLGLLSGEIRRDLGASIGLAGLPPAPLLPQPAGHSGFFNVAPDPDGVLRRVPLVIRHGGVLYPNLALAVYLRARGGDVGLEEGPAGGEAVLLEGGRIPPGPRGELRAHSRH